MEVVDEATLPIVVAGGERDDVDEAGADEGAGSGSRACSGGEMPEDALSAGHPARLLWQVLGTLSTCLSFIRMTQKAMSMASKEA